MPEEASLAMFDLHLSTIPHSIQEASRWLQHHWLLHGDQCLLTAVHGSTGPRAWVCNSRVLSQLATVLVHRSGLWGREGETCQMGRGLPGEMSCCKPSPSPNPAACLPQIQRFTGRYEGVSVLGDFQGSARCNCGLS